MKFLMIIIGLGIAMFGVLIVTSTSMVDNTGQIPSVIDSLAQTSPKPENDATLLEKDPSQHEYDATIQCQGNKMCMTEKVTRIVDGDTLYLDGGHEIRLSLTNTPERHETGFYEASQFTTELCSVGSVATVDQDDKQPHDVYGRILGKVTCADRVLNSELLYAGHANILSRYCHTSEFSDEAWAQEFGC